MNFAKYRKADLLLVCFVAVCFDLCKTTDQTCNGGSRSPVECYECMSYGQNMQQFCVDPFNRTHTGLSTAICHGPCVKWVRRPKDGLVRYVRTCSTRLQLRITVAMVCMKESPPDEGQLCFCHRDRCNDMAPSLHHDRPSRLTAIILSLIVATAVSGSIRIHANHRVNGTDRDENTNTDNDTDDANSTDKAKCVDKSKLTDRDKNTDKTSNTRKVSNIHEVNSKGNSKANISSTTNATKEYNECQPKSVGALDTVLLSSTCNNAEAIYTESGINRIQVKLVNATRHASSSVQLSSKLSPGCELMRKRFKLKLPDRLTSNRRIDLKLHLMS